VDEHCTLLPRCNKEAQDAAVLSNPKTMASCVYTFCHWIFWRQRQHVDVSVQKKKREKGIAPTTNTEARQEAKVHSGHY